MGEEGEFAKSATFCYGEMKGRVEYESLLRNVPRKIIRYSSVIFSQISSQESIPKVFSGITEDTGGKTLCCWTGGGKKSDIGVSRTGIKVLRVFRRLASQNFQW